MMRPNPRAIIVIGDDGDQRAFIRELSLSFRVTVEFRVNVEKRPTWP
jgi:hypothetical protein